MLKLIASDLDGTLLNTLDDLRDAVDAMEIIVGHEQWPVPTYNEILFYT